MTPVFALARPPSWAADKMSSGRVAFLSINSRNENVRISRTKRTVPAHPFIENERESGVKIGE